MSAQMKPHFLYNALTVIAESCETDPDEAGRLIISLSKYLRQTLDYDHLSGIVPLKKELELVHAYTSIERARFANIEIVFDLPRASSVTADTAADITASRRKCDQTRAAQKERRRGASSLRQNRRKTVSFSAWKTMESGYRTKC